MIRSFVAFLAAVLCVGLSMPAHANDAQIASQIVQRLRTQQQASNLKGFNIGVQVDEGTVTMMGNVADQEQATLALDIARRIPGVKLVVNDLGIGNAEQITQAPTSNPTMPGGNIRLTAAAAPSQPQVPTQASPFAAGTGVAAQQVAAPAPAGSQQPLAFAPATAPRSIRTASLGGAPQMVAGTIIDGGMPAGNYGGPVPTPVGYAGGVSTASYDNAQMPGYAWPSYSAYPNYGSVTYPQQYSATAWPYIGPFYPYPQVPLGWRKVMLEWDDGWWFLDFKSR